MKIQLLIYLMLFMSNLAYSKCISVLDGHEVCEPFQFKVHNAKQIVLYGLANYSKMDVKLKTLGLRPIRFDQNSAMISLTLNNYLNTDIGSYDEFVVSVLVEKRNTNQKYQFYNVRDFLLNPPYTDSNNPDWGFYTDHLTLDGTNLQTLNSAIEGGKKLMSFPKFKGQIELSFYPLNNQFLVREESLSNDFSIYSVVGNYFEDFKFYNYLDYHVITLGNVYSPCWTNVSQSGYASLFDFGYFDKLEVSGSLLSYLEELWFTPTNWSLHSNVEMNLYRSKFCN